MPPQRVPAIGEDVTSLMPKIGDDVTDLMGAGDPGSPSGKIPTGAGRHVDTVRPTDIHGQPIPFGSEDGGAANKFWSVAGEAFNPLKIAEQVGQLLMTDTNELTNNIIRNQVETFKGGAEKFGQGRYSEGIGGMAGGLLPLVGPAAVKAGERIGSGDVAGGLGESAGLLGGVLAPGAINQVGRAVRPAVAGGLRRAGIATARSGIKPERSYLQNMAGARGQGTPAMAERVMGTIIDEDLLGTSPMRNPATTGIQRAQEGIDIADMHRTSRALANAPRGGVPGSAAAADQSLTESVQAAGRGDAPQNMLGQVQDFARDARTTPGTTRTIPGAPAIPPTIGPGGMIINPGRPAGQSTTVLRDLNTAELASVIEANNQKLRHMFGQAELGPKAEALRDLQGTRTASLDLGADTAELSRIMRDLIDARNILGIADTRVSATNPVSLTDVMALSTMQPIALGASMATKGRNLMRMGGTLGKMGRRVGAPRDPSAILRALLQSGNFPEPEEPR